ncbi:MAG: fibronectin type III domain-containing protein, partial [bacterium]
AELKESVRKLYQVVAIPVQKGFKEEPMGVPTYGEERPIDKEVFEWLRTKGEILIKIAPVVLKEKYLSGREYISTEQIYQSSLRTPGEVRPVNRSVFEEGIAEGVRTGLFGLGELEDDAPVCRYFKEQPSVALSGKEILISEELCRKAPPTPVSSITATPGDKTVTVEWQGVSDATSYNLYWSEKSGVDRKSELKVSDVKSPYSVTGLENERSYYFVVTAENAYGESEASAEISARPSAEVRPPPPPPGIKKRIHLKFKVPRGKVAGIMGVMNMLQSKFGTLEIEIEATEGEMSDQDYEDKIKETFRQLGIEVEED